MKICQGRLWQSLMEMSKIGRLDNGGASRLALSDADKQGRDLFVSWCRDAGCNVSIDSFGNTFATRSGKMKLPGVLVGSHLDTQPNGGHFDGILGVLAGLEIIRAMNDAGIESLRPVSVVNWTNEEGARFPSGLSGSKGFAGVAESQEILEMRSHEGPSFEEELNRIGYRGQGGFGPADFQSYLELHIEQGPALFDANESLAIVDGVQASWRYEVEIKGTDRHAGTTPADARADSYLASARFAVEARAICGAVDPDVRFTIGRVQVEPNSPNTVPGLTRFTIDLRYPDEDALQHIENDFRKLLAVIDSAEGTISRIDRVMNVPTVIFNEPLVQQLAGLEHAPARRMMSGAMHDACMIAEVIPTAMIFVRCKDGISHSHEEWMEAVDAADACRFLADAVIACANNV